MSRSLIVIVKTIANPLGRRLRTAVAPNEAYDAGNQGSPMSEDHSDSGDDSGNDDDFAEAILSGRSSAAAQNDTHDTGSQTYPMSQSPLLSIHGKNDHSNLAGGLGSGLSSASAQNNAHDAGNHGSPMDHTSPMGQVPLEPDHVNDGCLAEILPSNRPSAPTQNDNHDASNQGSPLNVVFPLSLVSLVSQGSPVADHGSINHGSPIPCHDRSNQRSLTSHIPPMIQGSPVPDHYINNQPSPMRQTPIQLNHNSCTHAYLVETSLNTYKSNLASLCTHAIGILQSDPSKAQRFLDDLKEIANQMFTDTQRSLDWQRSPGRRS